MLRVIDQIVNPRQALLPEAITSCVETKNKGEKVVICLQGKELLEKPCTSSFFAFYKWA